MVKRKIKFSSELNEWKYTQLQNLTISLTNSTRKIILDIWATDCPQEFLIRLSDFSGEIVFETVLMEMTKDMLISCVESGKLQMPPSFEITQFANGELLQLKRGKDNRSSLSILLNQPSEAYPGLIGNGHQVDLSPDAFSNPLTNHIIPYMERSDTHDILITALLEGNLELMNLGTLLWGSEEQDEIVIRQYDEFRDFLYSAGLISFHLWNISDFLNYQTRVTGVHESIYWEITQSEIDRFIRYNEEGKLLIARSPYSICPIWSVTYPVDTWPDHPVRVQFDDIVVKAAQILARGFSVPITVG